jgi:glucan 1,3-beta-glucosidase
MTSFSFISLLVALRLFLLVAGAPAPIPEAQNVAASSYWLSSIARQGTIGYGTAGYQIFRNVKDFGARGDG